MILPTPHYLLKTETRREEGQGLWRFVMRPLDGSPEIEASDSEPDVFGERLDLLTVVRALESLDQPSWVTLIGCSRYVEEGVMFGLSEWKENEWRWEFFGQMTPIRDRDLWQRMDRIMQIHRVDCGRRRMDPPHGPINVRPHWKAQGNRKSRWIGLAAEPCVKLSALAMSVWRGLGWHRIMGLGARG